MSTSGPQRLVAGATTVLVLTACSNGQKGKDQATPSVSPTANVCVAPNPNVLPSKVAAPPNATQWDFTNGLPSDWHPYTTGTPATNQRGSYDENNICFPGGFMRLKATVEPSLNPRTDLRALPQHKGAALAGPDLSYGTFTWQYRLSWGGNPTGQFFKTILFLWAENNSDEPRAVESDVIETTPDAAKQRKVNEFANYGDSWDNRPPPLQAQVPLDSDWHQATVVRQPRLLVFYVDGKQTLRTTDPAQVPKGRQHPVIQVDFDGVPDSDPENAPRAEAAVDITSVTYVPYLRDLPTPGRTLSMEPSFTGIGQ